MVFRRPSGGFRGRFQAPVEDAHRINDRIRVPEVRLIDDKGQQLGVLPTSHAMKVAEDKGLDLVEVAPNAKPPVCRIMDYGKFKYKEQKKETEAKKNRSEIEIKELRIRYRTDSGDLETKLRKAREFLAAGDKVKFSMRFKGREIMYTDLGLEKLQEIIDLLADVSTVDERSPSRGRQIYIVLAPVKVAVATKAKSDQPAAAKAKPDEKAGDAKKQPQNNEPQSNEQAPKESASAGEP